MFLKSISETVPFDIMIEEVIFNLLFYAALEPVGAKKVVGYLVFRCGYDVHDLVLCNNLRRWNVVNNLLFPLQQFLIAAVNPAIEVKLNALNPHN